MKVATIGVNCIDAYEEEDKYLPGGNAVNFSIHLKRLGIETSYIGAVGNDSYGSIMIDAIKGEGVDISNLFIREGNTALTKVELVNSDRVFKGYDGGVLEEFKINNEIVDFVKQHDLLHSAEDGKVCEYIKRFKGSGVLVSLDFSKTFDDSIIRDIAPYVDHAFFSYNEKDEYIKDHLTKVKSYGVGVAIATLGENGSLAYDGHKFYHQGIIKDKVVDTLGAGDSFIAGYIYGVMNNKDISDCLKIGARTASKTIKYYGGF